MTDIRDVLAKNLKRLRALHGINQEKLAEAIGVSKETIAKTETRQNWLGAENLNKITEFFKVEPEELFICAERTAKAAPGYPAPQQPSALEMHLKAYIDAEIAKAISRELGKPPRQDGI